VNTSGECSAQGMESVAKRFMCIAYILKMQMQACVTPHSGDCEASVTAHHHGADFHQSCPQHRVIPGDSQEEARRLLEWRE